MTVEVGDHAPDFEVESTAGTLRLAELLADGPLVLVFYYEDATPTCTTQVSSFRDEYETFAELGARILAISADPLGSHERFVERLGELPFPLASDPELALARAYDVVHEEGKRARRAVFVIGADGLVQEAIPHYHPGAMEQFASVFRALGLDI